MAKKGKSKPKGKGWQRPTGDATRINFKKEGDSVQGKLLRVVDCKKGMKGAKPSKSYQILVTAGSLKGEQVYFFGSAGLDRDLAGLEGKEIRVEFEGKISIGGGKTFKKFDVQYRD